MALQLFLGQNKVKYGCGEIEKDIYDAVHSEFAPQLNDLKQKLEIAEINLSNYEPYIDYALQMSCKLGGLWNEFDIVKKEKLQNLVFPEGVFYDQKNQRLSNSKAQFISSFNQHINSKLQKRKKRQKEEIFNLSLSVRMKGVEPRLQFVVYLAFTKLSKTYR